MYESDITKFMREFLEKNPDVVARQKRFRATWWDKRLDPEQRKRWEESKIAPPSYPYYDNP
jgi:uncharacterized protein DUF3460